MESSDLFYIIRFFVSSATALLLALVVLGVRIPRGAGYALPRTAKYLLFCAFVELGVPISLIKAIRVTSESVFFYYLSDNLAYMMLLLAPAALVSFGKGCKLRRFLVPASVMVVSLQCYFLFVYALDVSWGAVPAWVFGVTSFVAILYMAVIYARESRGCAGWVPDVYFFVILGTAAYYQLLLPMFPGLDNYVSYLVMKVLFLGMSALFVIWFFEYSSRLRAAVAVVNDSGSDESAGKVPTQEKTISEEAAAALEQRLGKWVEEKHFLEQDEGIDLVAAQLGTDLKTLRTYFRTRMPSDFRTWRISLRIEFAKERLREDPGISVNRLSEMSGFATRSNFYHYFKKITGMTPVEYKEQLTDGPGNPNS